MSHPPHPAKTHDQALAQKLEQAFKLHQAGNLAAAAELYKDVLALHPEHPAALRLLGILAAQTDQHDEAVRLLSRIARGKQADALVHFHLANVYSELDRLGDAERHYRLAIKQNDRFVEAYNNLGNTLLGLSRAKEALDCFDQALLQRPTYAAAYCNRGNALQKLARPEDAVESFNKAIELKPDFVEAYNGRAPCLQELGRLPEALVSVETALKLRPNHLTALCNQSRVLLQLERYNEALSCTDKAIEHRVDFADAHVSRGNVLAAAGRSQEALTAYNKALAIDPNHGLAHYSKAFTNLLNGNLIDGFAEYEWGWHSKTQGRGKPHAFIKPLWLGSPSLEGRSILLHAEQGLGDTLQFCRYLDLVAAQGARVILEAPAILREILSTLSGVHAFVDQGTKRPNFDYHCPLMSLPYAFKTSLETIPCRSHYLEAQPERIEYWKNFIGAQGFKIAIAWQGKPTGSVEWGRSFPVRLFEPIAKLPGVRLISLQKGAAASQIKALGRDISIEVLPDSFDCADQAFIDSAAIMKCVDLVITSDTSLTHLAGALGVDAWLALKKVPDWRWFMDRPDSPWYPKHRLFRQPSHGNWLAVFEQMTAELKTLLANSNA